MGTKLVRFLAGGCFLSFVLVVVCAMLRQRRASPVKSRRRAPREINTRRSAER